MNHEVEILLVEDNVYDAEMTIRVLKKNHLANKLLHLRNGEEALDFLFCRGKYKDRSPQNGPKIILLDLKMPKINGIEVLEKIKSDQRTKALPVAVLTSSQEHPDVEMCYKLGVNSYVVKPVEFEQFVKTVTDLGLYWVLTNNPPDEAV